MATLLELAQLPGSPGFDALKAKITAASAIKAEDIINETSPSADRLAWAFEALDDPANVAKSLIYGILAANAGASTTQILEASDTAIQTNVDNFVDKLVP